MVSIRTVGEQMAQYGVPCNPDVTSSRKSLQATENAILEKFPHLEGIRIDGYTYKRYGYVLSDAVATNYATEQEAQTVGFQARLTNSGMAAIDTALRVALSMSATPKNSWLCHGGRLYPETLNLISEYGRLTGCGLVSINETDSIEMIDAASHKSRLKGDVYLFETVANHPAMTALATEKVLRLLWKDRVTLILDNTFASSMHYDIVQLLQNLTVELGEPTCTVVIVESLTKYYRTGEDDPVTAGIIMAPASFIAECDDVIARTGVYLPYHSLVQLPWSGMDALGRTVVPSSRNALLVADYLRAHELVESVGYPSVEEFTVGGESAKRFTAGAGAVLFFNPKPAVGDKIAVGMVQSFGSMMGSFGHPETTWIPWGQRVPGDYPESTIRLSCGWHDLATSIGDRLDKALRIAASAAV